MLLHNTCFKHIQHMSSIVIIPTLYYNSYQKKWGRRIIGLTDYRIRYSAFFWLLKSLGGFPDRIYSKMRHFGSDSYATCKLTSN